MLLHRAGQRHATRACDFALSIVGLGVAIGHAARARHVALDALGMDGAERHATRTSQVGIDLIAGQVGEIDGA